MVITPDIYNLPYKNINGIKYFELTAEPVNQEILPGIFIKGWGTTEVFQDQLFKFIQETILTYV